MHVVQTELRLPSLKSYSTCQATTPFAKVIFDLSGYSPLRLAMLMQGDNLNATTSTS